MRKQQRIGGKTASYALISKNMLNIDSTEENLECSGSMNKTPLLLVQYLACELLL